MQPETELSWPAEPRCLGARIIRQKHRLHTLDLFSDASLIALLERVPPRNIYTNSMGTDPARASDWCWGDPSRVSASELLDAVQRGRLWLNVRQIDRFDPRFRALTSELRARLAEICPHFQPVTWFGAMLISSPSALVYYHADAQPNLLWHVRGKKRVWVYPARDERFAPTASLERIFTGEMSEELHYEPEFDRFAEVFDLEPGDFVSWPQSSPHRVENQGSFNVTLSIEYSTRQTRRRAHVHAANRLFRLHFGLPGRSIEERGLKGLIKAGAYGAFKKLGLIDPPRRRDALLFRVDRAAPLGLVYHDRGAGTDRAPSR